MQEEPKYARIKISSSKLIPPANVIFTEIHRIPITNDQLTNNGALAASERIINKGRADLRGCFSDILRVANGMVHCKRSNRSIHTSLYKTHIYFVYIFLLKLCTHVKTRGREFVRKGKCAFA